MLDSSSYNEGYLMGAATPCPEKDEIELSIRIPADGDPTEYMNGFLDAWIDLGFVEKERSRPRILN